MSEDFPEYVSVDYTDGEGEAPADYPSLQHKIEKVIEVTRTGLEEYAIDGVISGVSWDEQDARADETFFSPRHDPDIYPPHDRVQPILEFDEADVWDVFWNYVVPDTVEAFPEDGYVPQSADDLPEGVAQDDVPISPK